MRFFDPTNTYAEKNCVKNHKKELLALGSRAFVITGHRSSKKNGSLDDVIAVLEEASVPYQIFNEIEENPSVSTDGFSSISLKIEENPSVSTD